jgi:thiamine-phosphate pyrophosphorylase
MTRDIGAPTLPHPALVLVTDLARLRGRALEDVVREAVAGGANVVQLRAPDVSHEERVALGTRLLGAIGRRALFFVNGDVRAAAMIADGIHLPEASPAMREVRELRSMKRHLLVSRAVHSVDAAVRAERGSADIVQIGTVFETASKPGREPIGLDGVRAVCGAVRVPVIAIGGITASNAGGVMRAGAAGVAVIGAIFDPDDARAAAADLRRAIDDACAGEA